MVGQESQRLDWISAETLESSVLEMPAADIPLIPAVLGAMRAPMSL